MKCPDAHFRRAVFELGPVIADYPEQVYLSGVVQGWCPKSVSPHCCARHALMLPDRCRAYPEHLDQPGPPRFREHTDALMETFDPGILWDVFGVNANVQVRRSDLV